jgi:hypothetical protein
MFLDSERQDSEYALKVDLKPVNEAVGHDTCMTWKNRLNNRCKDLLEVKFHRDGDTSGVNFLRYRVDFLHRSDFLSLPYIERLLAAALSTPAGTPKKLLLTPRN